MLEDVINPPAEHSDRPEQNVSELKRDDPHLIDSTTTTTNNNNNNNNNQDHNGPSGSSQQQPINDVLYRVLSHPSPSSSNAPLQTLSSLPDHQLEIYNSLHSTFSSPSYRLPVSSSNKNSISRKNSLSQRNGSEKRKDESEDESGILTERERCYCSEECLLRVLRATKFDLEKSILRLQSTLIWRRQYGVDEIDLDVVSKESETGKQFVLGYDRQSRPCLYMFPHRQNTKPSPDQVKLVVWTLERAIDLMPPGVESLSLLVDYGASQSNMSGPPTTISQAKEVIKILQTHYCERLGKAICVNVPWVFWGFYKLIKPFLDPRTAEKIEFDPNMPELVPPEHLPQDTFGGDLDFEYNHEEYFPLIVKLADQRKKEMFERYQRIGGNKIGISETLLKSDEPEQVIEEPIPEPTIEPNKEPTTESMIAPEVAPKEESPGETVIESVAGPSKEPIRDPAIDSTEELTEEPLAESNASVESNPALSDSTISQAVWWQSSSSPKTFNSSLGEEDKFRDTVEYMGQNGFTGHEDVDDAPLSDVDRTLTEEIPIKNGLEEILKDGQAGEGGGSHPEKQEILNTNHLSTENDSNSETHLANKVISIATPSTEKDITNANDLPEKDQLNENQLVESGTLNSQQLPEKDISSSAPLLEGNVPNTNQVVEKDVSGAEAGHELIVAADNEAQSKGSTSHPVSKAISTKESGGAEVEVPERDISSASISRSATENKKSAVAPDFPEKAEPGAAPQVAGGVAVTNLEASTGYDSSPLAQTPSASHGTSPPESTGSPARAEQESSSPNPQTSRNSPRLEADSSQVLSGGVPAFNSVSSRKSNLLKRFSLRAKKEPRGMINGNNEGTSEFGSTNQRNNHKRNSILNFRRTSDLFNDEPDESRVDESNEEGNVNSNSNGNNNNDDGQNPNLLRAPEAVRSVSFSRNELIKRRANKNLQDGRRLSLPMGRSLINNENINRNNDDGNRNINKEGGDDNGNKSGNSGNGKENRKKSTDKMIEFGVKIKKKLSIKVISEKLHLSNSSSNNNNKK